MSIFTLTGREVVELPEDSPIDSFVAHLSTHDPDTGDNGRVTCTLTSELDTFVLDSISDKGQYKLMTSTALDHERRASYSLMLDCADRGSPPRHVSANQTVRVIDINDNPPVFTRGFYNVSLAENNLAHQFLNFFKPGTGNKIMLLFANH